MERKCAAPPGLMYVAVPGTSHEPPKIQLCSTWPKNSSWKPQTHGAPFFPSPRLATLLDRCPRDVLFPGTHLPSLGRSFLPGC